MNRIAQLLSRLLGPLREFGWSEGTLYFAARLLQATTFNRCRIVRYQIVAQPIPAAPAPISASASTTLIELIAPEDPRRLDFPRPKSVIEARFAAGCRCLMATVKGRFAGFIWIANNRYDEDEVRCRYVLAAPGVSVWDFDVYVEPEFRIGRTFSRLWESANRMLAAEGVRWSFSRISSFNLASIRSHARLGTQCVQTVTFLCLWDTQFSFSPRKPFLTVCRSDTGKPEILLPAPESP